MSRRKAEPSPDPTRPSVSPEAALARVRAAGLKLTPQRMAIVRQLASDPTHPTAQELHERLRPQLPTMSFATVYNTLDALAAAGLCLSRALVPGAARFDANMAPHDHVVCEGCGLVRDVHRGEPAASQSSSRAASVSTTDTGVDGFVVRAVEQIYRGLCSSCLGSSRAGSARGASEHPGRAKHNQP